MYTHKILHDLPAVPEEFEKEAWGVITQVVSANSDKLSSNDNVAADTNDVWEPADSFTFQLDKADITPNDLRPNFKNRRLHKDGKEFPSTRTIRHDLSDEFKNWVRKNIVDSWTEVSVSVTPASLSDAQGPHTDWTNNLRLIYVLNEGGPDCRTVWYQEKNQPFYRGGREWLSVEDYALLDERDSIRMPRGKWCIISTQHLHGVVDITEDRVTIHVGLLTDENIKTTLLNLETSN